MVYTDIQTLRGLGSNPTDYGSGVEYADGLADLYASQHDVSGGGGGLQIGLWLNGTAGCRDLVEGKLDDNVHQLFSYISASRFEKVFLRVGYEFDNPDFGYSGNDGKMVA